MTKYRILNYDSWNELKKDITEDICENVSFPYNRYIFRGHINADWKLMAAFDRKYGKLPFDDRKKLEDLLIEDFKDLCITWDGKEKF